MSRNIKLSLILVALMGQANAQDTNVVTLKPLSITSTAIQTDELKSTDAVEVYTQDDIEKAHVQNVYEFLNQQTSVIATPTYGNPFSQKLDMRGFGNDGYQNIVVNINGRRVNNIDTVAPLLSAISPSSISRLEIIKSSGIVTSGDGANAGVINITTKRNNDKEISFYLGTYGLASGSFYVGHSDDTLSVSASGEAQKSSGIRHIDANGGKDANKLATGNFDLAYTPTEELEFRLGASFARTDVIFGGSMKKDEYKDDPAQQGTKYQTWSNSWVPSTSAHLLYDTDTLSSGLSYFINDELSLNIDANREKKKSQYPAYSFVSNYLYDSTKISLDYETDSLSLSLGYDSFDGERVGSTNTTTKNNKALYLMSNYSFGNSNIKAGYRFENVAYVYDSSTTLLKQDDNLHGAELGYNYTLDKESSLFINYSHSYQAPDIDRFFATTYPPPTYTPVTGFNQFIEPSKANNYNLGYNNITPSNKFKITAYYTDMTNEIYLDKSSNAFGDNRNIDKSHKYGLDLYDKYLISPEFNIALNYNFVQAIIDEELSESGTEDYSGKKLPGVSDHNIKATLSYLPNAHATIALTQIYRSEAYAADDFNNNFSQKQDAYNSTDISATYAKDNYEVFAKINNLFNVKNGLWIKDDAIYPVNFTTTAMAGLKLKF